MMLGERSCADYLRTHWPWPNASDDAPVVLTSATSVPRRWLLGLSAAREGLPLVVASLGEPGGWKWNEGTARKLPGARAAVEMLSSARPSAAVIMLDGSDTTVLNPWQSTAAPAALSKLGQEAVLVGGECNSWPICYEQAYDSNPPDGYRDCRARSLHTCYPNGGTFLARAAPMLAFLRALEAAVAATLASPNRAEVGYDQAALHWLLLKRAKAGVLVPPTSRGGAAIEVGLRVDSLSRVFLNLYACPQRERLIKYVKGFVSCSVAPHEPLEGLRVRGKPGGKGRDALEYLHLRNATSPAGAAGPRARPESAANGNAARPFVAHSNGRHVRLERHPLFAKLHAQLARPREARRWLDHPVLLVHAANTSASTPARCEVTRLGRVLDRGRGG
jgi:hypothetical protein